MANEDSNAAIRAAQLAQAQARASAASAKLSETQARDILAEIIRLTQGLDSEFLEASNNLSDLDDVVAARTNLGLGSAALQPDTAFLQSDNNLSDITDEALARGALGIGTMGVQDADSVFIEGGRVIVSDDPVDLLEVATKQYVDDNSGGSGGADWTVGICRIYAIDFVNGNDSNLGYADPASSSSVDYAIACQLAGTRALKTFAGLAAIFPRYGNGRQVEIVVANGGVNISQTYSGAISDFLGGSSGYSGSCPTVRGTGTNTTAGCVAFDGSSADVTYQGAITGTGMNSAGYKPTGTPTTSVVQCVLFAGGSPSFATELAIPSGLRVRFDANTATVALRNVCRHVCQVSGGDTLTWTTALPATPTSSDVFYIEQAGYTSGGFALGSNSNARSSNMQVSGGAFSSTVTTDNMRINFTACQLAGITSTNDLDCTLIQTFNHPVYGNLTVGGNRSSGSCIFITARTCSVTNLVSTGSVTATNVSTFTMGNGFACSGTIVVSTPLAGAMGGTGAVVGTTARLVNNSIAFGSNGGLTGGYYSIQQLSVNNSPLPGIFLRAEGLVLDLGAQATTSSSITGSGNANYGLDLSEAKNCTIFINVTNPPTLTGTLGNVVMADGRLLTWTQCVNSGAGVVDQAGNRIIPSTATSLGYRQPALTKLKFAGKLFGGAGAAFTYIADSIEATVNNTLPFRYGTLGFAAVFIYITPMANNMANACTVTLYRNGSAASTPISIPAGSTVQVVGSTIVNFSHTDQYDVRVDVAGADAGNSLTLSVTVEGY